MLKIYDPATARATLLKRTPPDQVPLPAALLERIAIVFGEALTPAQAVRRILEDVRQRGDAALQAWTEKLDGVRLARVRLPEADLRAALEAVKPELSQALEAAAQRIEAFYRRQPLTSWLTPESGGWMGQLVRPIRRVGLYIPAGSAPLPSTVLMSAIPAKVAGVSEIALATPPQPESGQAHPLILAAAALVGVQEVYLMGGAQAIAALAFGTESISAVDKIFGPGNLFVTLAKQQVFGSVGIDGLAGPTETMVIADESANPAWVAADLLAQAEHDMLASAILLTPSRALAEAVQAQVARQMEGVGGYTPLGRGEIIAAALENRSGIVLTRDLEEAVELANLYAPEHLALSVAHPWRWAEKVQAAGCLFLGEHSFEVLGDYVAGPSHVLPTGGTARFASALNVWDFVHVVGLVGLEPATAARIAPIAAALAEAEGLDAHARAARLRLGG